jgi:hypothetical protein
MGGHCCSFCRTIYKIDGKTGEIIWRLSGMKSNFIMGTNATFYYEHDARWVIEGKRLSLIDNGSTCYSSSVRSQ